MTTKEEEYSKRGKSFDERKEQFKKEMGKRLRHYRNKRGMTLRGLAEKIDFTAGYIGLLEQGKNAPNTFILKELSDALGIPVSAFFGEEEIIDSINELQDPILVDEENEEYLDLIKKAILNDISPKKIERTLEFLMGEDIEDDDNE